ncbi:MAG: hypothetical protein AAF533_16085 [Acidobacteriota bacterium]
MTTLLRSFGLALAIGCAGSSFATTLLYDSEGRRDPFREPGFGEATDVRCPDDGTLASVQVGELRLTGIATTPTGTIATFEGGPWNRGYFVRVGDALCDGEVLFIDAARGAVTVRQPTESVLKPFKERVVLLEEEAPRRRPGRR